MDSRIQGRPEKIKIGDLRPLDAQKFGPHINFNVITFSVPASSVVAIPKAFSLFSSPGAVLSYPDLLAKNGLLVFAGQASQGGQLTIQFQYLNARRSSRLQMAINDGFMEFMETAMFETEQYLFLMDQNDREISGAFLPGRVGWIFQARSTPNPGQVRLTLVPGYVPLQAMVHSTGEYLDEFSSTHFVQGQVSSVLKEGDFLILAPNRVLDRTTLDTALFGSNQKEGFVSIYVVIYMYSG